MKYIWLVIGLLASIGVLSAWLEGGQTVRLMFWIILVNLSTLGMRIEAKR